MRTFRLFVVSAIFTAIISASAFAQAQPATSKIGVIYTGAFFDDKAGIGKVVNVSKVLATEFTVRRNELTAMLTKAEALQKEINDLQDKAAKGVPIDEAAARAKVAQLEQLQREFKFKKEEFDKAVERREAELMGPVFQEIGKSLGEYAKTKGFAMVVDGSKDQSQMIVFVSEAIDITDEFIKSFNGPTGAPVTPKPAVKPN